MNAPAELVLGRKSSLREAGLWTVAAVAVVLAHVAVSFAFQAMQEHPEVFSAEETMVVELEPVAFTSAASVAPSDVISEEDSEATAPEEVAEIEQEQPAESLAEESPEPVETQEPPVQRAEPEETPVVTEEAEPEVATEELPDPVEQDVVEAVEPEVVIPLPRPERVVEETPPEKPRKVAEKKPRDTVEKKPERRKAETPKPVKKADARTEAKSRSSSQVEQRAASTPTVNPSRWNNAVQRAIARRARGARGTRGSVSIAFMVDSSGAISAARVAQSSGNSRLDSTALNIVRSARVPAPPPGLSGSHAFTIPMTFR